MSEKNLINRKKIKPETVTEANNYTRELLKNKLPDTFRFHTIEHTQEVLKFVEIIGNYYKLNTDEINILKISAIFHDTGYTKKYKGHEKEGVKIARNFLEENHIEESQIKRVEKTIMSTKVPQKPHDLLSKIICDADLINLTYDNYFESAELMRQEWENTGFAKMNEIEFHTNSVQFFKSHKFQTDYAKKYLHPKKMEVLERIQKRLSELKNQSKL